MLILAFLALMPRLMLGIVVMQMLWNSSDLKYLGIKLFLAAPIGIGLSSMLSFLWLWAGMDPRVYAWVETGFISVWLIFMAWKQRHEISAVLKRIRLRISKENSLWGGILATGLFIYTGEFWVNALKDPHGGWDAWYNWNVVARFIYRGGEHWTGTFLRVYDHPDYPFLLAMSNVTTWELLSRETTRGPMVLGFLFTICLAGLLFSLIYVLRGFPQAALAAVVLMSQPIVANIGMAQLADLPEAFYFLASLGLLPVYMMSREKGLPILAGFLAGLSAWTKNEGLAFIILSLLAWGFLDGEKSSRPLKYFMHGLAFPAFIVILFKVFLAPSNDLIAGQKDTLAVLLDMERYGYILASMGRAFWEIGAGPISITALLVVYSIVMGKTHRSTDGIKQVVFVIFLQLLVYFFIYVTTPHDLDWHIDTSIGRLYLHVFPLVLLVFFLWVKPPNELIKVD